MQACRDRQFTTHASMQGQCNHAGTDSSLMQACRESSNSCKHRQFTCNSCKHAGTDSSLMQACRDRQFTHASMQGEFKLMLQVHMQLMQACRESTTHASMHRQFITSHATHASMHRQYTTHASMQYSTISNLQFGLPGLGVARPSSRDRLDGLWVGHMKAR